MKKIAALTVAALVAVSALGSTAAEARGGGGALAAGIIGGLAAGALLGAAIADAHQGAVYGDGRPGPAYGDAYGPPAPVRYRPIRVVRDVDVDDAPVDRGPRVMRPYDMGREGYGYRSAGHGFRRHCDRSYEYGGW